MNPSFFILRSGFILQISTGRYKKKIQLQNKWFEKKGFQEGLQLQNGWFEEKNCAKGQATARSITLMSRQSEPLALT